MLIKVTETIEKKTQKGDTYLEVHGINLKNDQETKQLIWAKFAEYWELFQPDAVIELVLEKKTRSDGTPSWNVVEIKPQKQAGKPQGKGNQSSETTTPPKIAPQPQIKPSTQSKEDSINTNVAIKEIGETIRAGLMPVNPFVHPTSMAYWTWVLGKLTDRPLAEMFPDEFIEEVSGVKK